MVDNRLMSREDDGTGGDPPPDATAAWLGNLIQSLRDEMRNSGGHKFGGNKFGGNKYGGKKFGGNQFGASAKDGTTTVPVPVAPEEGVPNAGIPTLKPGSVNIAETTAQYPGAPGPGPFSRQGLPPTGLPQDPNAFSIGQANAGTPPGPSREDLEKLLFTPPPANMTAAAPPVGGAVPMGVGHPQVPPPSQVPPSPQIPMGTGPNQGGGRAVASPGSYGAGGQMLSPAMQAVAQAVSQAGSVGPQGPGGPPGAPDPRLAGLPPGATMGPEFAQGMDPRILMALAGAGRGRQ